MQRVSTRSTMSSVQMVTRSQTSLQESKEAPRKRKYMEKDSPEKRELNQEVAAWMKQGYEPGKKIWFLDVPALQTFAAVCRQGIRSSDFVIVESESFSITKSAATAFFREHLLHMLIMVRSCRCCCC